MEFVGRQPELGLKAEIRGRVLCGGVSPEFLDCNQLFEPLKWESARYPRKEFIREKSVYSAALASDTQQRIG